MSEARSLSRPGGRRLQVAAVALAIVVLLLAIVALALISHRLWLPGIGRFLVVSDAPQPVDALVPLAGGQGRVVYGARLFDEGYARWFVATNMPLNTPGIRESYGELVRREAVWQGVPEERILTVRGTAITTYDEAIAVRQLAQQQGWDSLLVVTDPFHTRRARMAFQDVFRGTGISVWVHAVNGGWYVPDSWWRGQDSVRVTWTEYVAMVLYLFGYH